VDPTESDIELAFGLSESAIISAVRFPGRSSEDIDTAFVEI
jgi:hypothetical protein